jgi:hypothetical protein
MRFALILLLVLATGCRDQRPPAPTAEQANQLNEAENILDREAANEKGPEANASGPSNSSD